MSLLDVRASIVTTLSAALPKGTSVQPHRGRFDSAAEIQKFAAKAPAVLVAFVGAAMRQPGSGLAQMPANWAIYVITRDVPQLPRDAGAIALVEALMLQIGGNCWGRTDLAAPSEIRAQNLYAGSIDNLGVALWAVTFDQLVTDPEVDVTTLNDFVTFHQDIDMTPADGQIDITETDTLPQQ